LLALCSTCFAFAFVVNREKSGNPYFQPLKGDDDDASTSSEFMKSNVVAMAENVERDEERL
jgi:hypothetical protein